jgi:moderate conductance mechanosensitive channel
VPALPAPSVLLSGPLAVPAPTPIPTPSPRPTSTVPGGEIAEIVGRESVRWFDALITPAWQIALTITVGAVVLALVRTSIAHTVQRIVDGTPTMHRHATALLARGLRQDRPDVDPSPLGAARRVQRAETMGSVLRSISGFVIGALVIVICLGILEVNVGPLLASAGVVGVALGFGAQTLVKDFLAGISMLVEDQYGVGDVVDLGEATGVVEQVGLRVTQVRSLNGTLWYVRNGEILRVGNMTQGWSRAVVEVRVMADDDVPRVRELLLGAAAAVAADPELGHTVLEDPEVAGIEDLTADGVLLRLLVKTAPSKQWDVARELRARIRESLREQGIELALPRREVVVERPAPGAAGSAAGAPGSAGGAGGAAAGAAAQPAATAAPDA